MRNDIKKLKEFQKWFDKFIKKNYGRKCTDFNWNCPVCRAYFVKDLFDDLVRDIIETNNYFKKRKSKNSRG